MRDHLLQPHAEGGAPGEPPSNLFAALAARARGASDGRLVADALAGIGAATVLALWRPTAWPVWLGAALCLGCYGLWGVADRSDAADGSRALHRALRAARLLLAVIGVAAALVVLFGALALSLGTWIS